jgi:osmotically-inducible protein OsmY
MKRKIIVTTVASLIAGGFAAVPAFADDEVKNDAQRTTARAGEAMDDAGLLAKIKSNMLRSPEVEGLDVNVDVKDGVVTLSGSADTQAEKASAEKIAKTADGVKRVDNRIIIKADNANDNRPAVPPATPPAMPGTPPTVAPPPAN